jgi:hypothetical protein
MDTLDNLREEIVRAVSGLYSARQRDRRIRRAATAREVWCTFLGVSAAPVTVDGVKVCPHCMAADHAPCIGTGSTS